MLERGSRAEAGHLASDGEGPCGRPAPEARRGASASDPGGVPCRDGKRPAGTNPRADDLRARGLTAPAPARLLRGRRSSLDGAAAAEYARPLSEDGREMEQGRQHVDLKLGLAGAAAHHQASASDEAARRGGGADPPLDRACGLREDDARARVAVATGTTRALVPRTDGCFGRRSRRSFAVQGACATFVDDRAEHARVAGCAHDSGGGTGRDR